MSIIVGSSAINRAASDVGKTNIIKENPATATGTIDHLEAYIADVSYARTDVVFASFIDEGSNTFSSRGNTPVLTGAEGLNEWDAPGDFTAFDINSGDYIGAYIEGSIDLDNSGEGVWVVDGNQIPEESGVYTFWDDMTRSIYASGTESETRTYSRGNYATLPLGKDDLESGFTSGDYTKVDTDDNDYLPQMALGEYAVKQFIEEGSGEICFSITWKGYSTRAPSISRVYLQVFNVTQNLWKTVDSNGSAGAGEEFTLSTTQPQSGDLLSDYFESGNTVAVRVYQEAI